MGRVGPIGPDARLGPKRTMTYEHLIMIDNIINVIIINNVHPSILLSIYLLFYHTA